MHKRVSLFNNSKLCEICGRPLSSDSEETLCNTCKENKLFQEVKEFIRAYDVNEYMVADYFKIPLKQVKTWIKEGRIEYKDKEAQKTIEGLHCQKCGAPITFGTMCTKCMKLQNSAKGYATQPQTSNSDNKMRYLDND